MDVQALGKNVIKWLCIYRVTAEIFIGQCIDHCIDLKSSTGGEVDGNKKQRAERGLLIYYSQIQRKCKTLNLSF